MDVDEPPAAAPLPRVAPFLHVARGEPTPEELAALAVVLAARSAATDAPAAPPASAWASREVPLRRPLHPGPGAWRGAALVPGARTRAAP